MTLEHLHVEPRAFAVQRGDATYSQIVKSIVVRRKVGLKGCYAAALQRNSTTFGDVSIEMSVGAAGRVLDIHASRNASGDAAFASCIVDKIRDWRFEPPRNGSTTELSFTISFENRVAR